MIQMSLGEAATVLERSYSRCWHAFAYGRVPWPRRVGRTFVLDEHDLAALKTYFENEREDEDSDPVADDYRFDVVNTLHHDQL